MNRQALLLLLSGCALLVWGVSMYSLRAAVIVAAVLLLLCAVGSLDVGKKP